jgi:hypothetical protein
MFSHNARIKSTFFQRFCEYIRANAFIGDDGGDPEFHLLPLAGDLSDRFRFMSSTQCRIPSPVQGLFHMARCR